MRCVLFFSLLVGLLLLSMANATIIHVPADYSTIQAGINASVNGDTVLVAPGVYVENINFGGHSIVLSSQYLFDHDTSSVYSTVIDGNNNGSAVLVSQNQDTTTEILGLSIRGGNRSGIRAQSASLKVTSCVVKNNTATGEGSYGNGGGLCMIGGYFQIAYNIIENNSAVQGGAIWIQEAGGAIHRNVIAFDSSIGVGPGILVYGGGTLIIDNNTVCYNHHTGDQSGAIYLLFMSGGWPVIENNIVAFNHGFGISQVETPVYTINYNDVFQNLQGNYYSIIPSNTDISIDPLFIDGEPYDFHLMPYSPCVDAGNPLSPLDADGTRADMGALYFNQFGDRPSLWHVSTSGDDTTGNGSEENPFRTIQRGIDMANDGDTVLIGPGTYTGAGNRAITTNGKAILVKGTAGADSTIIDVEGGQYGFYLEQTLEDTTTIFDGFTIKNALYGIYESSASLKLRGLKIIDCSINGVGNYFNFGDIYIIEDCFFINNGTGLMLDGKRARLNQCTFLDNDTAIFSYPYTNPISNLDSCFLGNNSVALTGGEFQVFNSVIRGGQFAITSYFHGWMVFSNCFVESTTTAVIYAGTGSYTFNNSVISNNLGYVANSGAYSDDLGPLTLNGCLIESNVGGIHWENDLVMATCTYRNNAGISFRGNTLNIDSSQIINCSGDAIQTNGIISPTQINNTIIAGCSGFGLRNSAGLILSLSSSTISENAQGGVSLSGQNVLSVRNTVVADNGGSGITIGDGSVTHTIIFSDFWGNTGGNYVGIPDQTGLNGNISENPLFTGGDPYDYHLLSPSPCIDAADPASELDPDGTRADMGAYYYHQTQLNPFNLISPGHQAVLTNTLPTLEWSSTSHQDTNVIIFYRAYWDDNGSFATPDSSGDLPDTAYVIADSLSRSTSYYWKVMAVGIHALPRESDETRSFHIDGFPTQPAIIEPPNGAQANSATYLVWLASTDPDSFDAVSYTIQVDNDSGFASPEINQSGLSSRSLLLDDAFAIRLGELEGYGNLQADTNYFWRVRADDSYGLSSEWTDGTNWFTFLPQNHAPSPPDSGFSPANGEEVISLTPVITWNDADDPDPDDNGDNLSYAIRLSEDSLFGGFVYYDTTAPGINQISPSTELDDNSHYYYQVKTIDDGGLSSDWSALQNFWTNHYNFPPEPFPLYGPENGARQVVFNTHFGWGGTVDYDPNATFTYSFQWSADSLFVGFVRTIIGLTDTVLTIPTDTLSLLGQNIFWRILAIDDDSLIQTGGIPEHFRALDILPPGDANSNGTTNGVDVTYLVNYLKGLGPAPDPLLAGDANGNCETNGVDVSYLVNYLKGFGSEPLRPNCLPGM